jgi:hypothetical protein
MSDLMHTVPVVRVDGDLFTKYACVHIAAAHARGWLGAVSR